MLRGDVPILYGFSPSLLPPPPDWPGHYVVTGQWETDNSGDSALPENVRRFIGEGRERIRQPPLVYVGFWGANYLHGKTLRGLGCRALIHTESLPPFYREDTLIVGGEIPHRTLFPMVDGIVHHGGARTFAAATRAGKPSLAIFSTEDSGFWARRAYTLGISPSPLSRESAYGKDLLDAFREQVESPALRVRADESGALLRAENGVIRAADLILRLMISDGILYAA